MEGDTEESSALPAILKRITKSEWFEWLLPSSEKCKIAAAYLNQNRLSSTVWFKVI